MNVGTLREAARRVCRSTSAAILIVVWGSTTARTGAWQGQSASLARFIPAEGLVVCAEFDGLKSHLDAWKQTAARSVLVETTTGAMLENLLSQVVESVSAKALNAPLSGAQVLAVFRHITSNGFILAVNQSEPVGAPPLISLVIRGGGEAAVKEPLERLLRSAVPDGAVTQVLTRQDGRKLLIVRASESQPGWTFWSEGTDLVLSIGREDAGADRVIATLEHKEKSAEELDIRARLKQTDAGFEPVAWAWLEGAALPPTPPALGLGGLKQVDYRWGFRGKELYSVTRIVAPKPRTGLLAILEQPSLSATNLPPIPAGTHEFLAISIDLVKAYDIVTETLATLDPNAKAAIDSLNQAVTQQTGLKLRDDVLATFGPRMAFYVEPRVIPAPITPIDALGAWATRMPPIVAVAETPSPDKLLTTLDALAKTANGMLAGTAQGDAGPIRMTRLAGTERGYQIVVPPQIFPTPTSFDPGIIIDSKYVAVSNSLDGPRLAMRIANGKADRVQFEAAQLPAGLIAIETRDPRDRMPEIIANLPFAFQLLGRTGPGFPVQPPPSDNPFTAVAVDRKLIPRPDAIREELFPGSTTVTLGDDGLTITTRDSIPTFSLTNTLPIAAGLLLPAVSASREAAQRSQSVNNLKQIALAMHNHAAQNGDRFPAAAIRDADGKPLLSWRVAILPYIEQAALYQEFHLDEPWDSAHNKTLLEKMPQIYMAPTSHAKMSPDHTFYQGFAGDGAFFEKEGDGNALQSFTDGTSNTIMVVEAGKAVPWTKPEDLEFDPEKPLPKLGGPGYPGGFDAAFCDGSVKFLKHTINKDVIKALITRNGGEVVSAEDLFQ